MYHLHLRSVVRKVEPWIKHVRRDNLEAYEGAEYFDERILEEESAVFDIIDADEAALSYDFPAAELGDERFGEVESGDLVVDLSGCVDRPVTAA